MGMEEALQWQEYRQMRGGFNVGRRVDAQAALLRYTYVASRSKSSPKIEDFLPFEFIEPTETREIDPNALRSLLESTRGSEAATHKPSRSKFIRG